MHRLSITNGESMIKRYLFLKFMNEIDRDSRAVQAKRGVRLPSRRFFKIKFGYFDITSSIVNGAIYSFQCSSSAPLVFSFPVTGVPLVYYSVIGQRKPTTSNIQSRDSKI